MSLNTRVMDVAHPEGMSELSSFVFICLVSSYIRFAACRRLAAAFQQPDHPKWRNSAAKNKLVAVKKKIGPLHLTTTSSSWSSLPINFTMPIDSMLQLHNYLTVTNFTTTHAFWLITRILLQVELKAVYILWGFRAVSGWRRLGRKDCCFLEMGCCLISEGNLLSRDSGRKGGGESNEWNGWNVMGAWRCYNVVNGWRLLNYRSAAWGVALGVVTML